MAHRRPRSVSDWRRSKLRLYVETISCIDKVGSLDDNKRNR